MTSQGAEETEAQNGTAPRPRRPTLIRVFQALKRRRHRKKSDAEEEHRIRVWSGRVGWLTFVLAICASLNVIIIFFQLREMHSGGIDTHNLAGAAHDQAVATDKLRQAGEGQAAAMEKLRLAGELQATAARIN